MQLWKVLHGPGRPGRQKFHLQRLRREAHNPAQENRKRTAREPRKNDKTKPYRLHNWAYVIHITGILVCGVMAFSFGTKDLITKGIYDEDGNFAAYIFILLGIGVLSTVSGIYMLTKRTAFFVDFGSRIRVVSWRGSEVFRWSDMKSFRIEFMEDHWENTDDKTGAKPALVLKFLNGKEFHLDITEKRNPACTARCSKEWSDAKRHPLNKQKRPVILTGRFVEESSQR